MEVGQNSQPFTSGIISRTSSRDLKKMLKSWETLVLDQSLVEKGADYYNGNKSKELLKWAGKLTEHKLIPELDKAKKTEQEGKSCRVAKTLVFIPMNDVGDIKAKVVIENRSDKTKAFMLTSSNCSNYIVSQRVGKIPPKDSICVDVVSNLNQFTEEAPMDREYIYVEVMETTNVSSTSFKIMQSFHVAPPSSVESHYVDKFLLLPEDRSSGTTISTSGADIGGMETIFEETEDPATHYHGHGPSSDRTDDSEAVAFSAVCMSVAALFKQIQEHFEEKIRTSYWFGVAFCVLVLGMAYGCYICYKMFHP